MLFQPNFTMSLEDGHINKKKFYLEIKGTYVIAYSIYYIVGGRCTLIFFNIIFQQHFYSTFEHRCFIAKDSNNTIFNRMIIVI